MLTDGGAVSPSLVNLWLRLSSEPRSHLERAFVWACAFGRAEVVELLLAHGVDPRDGRRQHDRPPPGRGQARRAPTSAPRRTRPGTRSSTSCWERHGARESGPA
jgi:hypothetical protein